MLLLVAAIALGSRSRDKDDTAGKTPPAVVPEAKERPEAPRQVAENTPPDAGRVGNSTHQSLTPAAPLNAVTQEDAWKGAVNLLAMVQPARDTVAGEWTIRDGILCTGTQPYSRLAVPYMLPDEYDVRLAFTRKSGNECIVVNLALAGQPFTLMLAGWKNRFAGFEVIAGKRARDVETNTRDTDILENDRRYTVIVQVRRNRLKAVLDGKPIAEREADLDKLSVAGHWATQHAPEASLGLGTIGPYEFHQFQLLELSGKGRAVSRTNCFAVTAYEFSQGKDLGWKPVKNLAPFVFRDGVLATEASGPDAQMTVGSADTYALDITHLVFRMRSTQAGTTQVYFATEGSSDMGKNGTVSVPCKGNNEWGEYEVRLAGQKGFAGKLKALRLDPVNNGGEKAKIEFAWIRLIRKL